MKIKTGDYPQASTNELIRKLTNDFAYYPATGVLKFKSGDARLIVGIRTGWRVNVAYTNGTAESINLENFFASNQSVASDNPNRLINWTEACRAVNSF